MKNPVFTFGHRVGRRAVLFRRAWPLALLWLPAIFYVACIAWGSVPIYVPQWYPFGYYNVRYGLQLLPAIAVFAGLVVYFMDSFLPRRFGLLLFTLIALELRIDLAGNSDLIA